MLYRCVAVVASLLVATALGELLLRLSGRGPWKHLRPRAKEQMVHDRDPVIGWRTRPGRYHFPPYAPGGEAVEMTFLPDGTRATGLTRPVGKHRIIFVGGSFTLGWAISDHQTFAWKVQERYPNRGVLNVAVDGYGTYQSLLALRRYFRREPGDGSLVVYGFICHHADRNVATHIWWSGLAYYAGRRPVYLPYCDLTDDRTHLREHPPRAYPDWPLMRRLALVNAAADLYARYLRAGAEQQKTRVTRLLIEEMDRLARDNGARFVVAWLFCLEGRARYRAFFDEKRILVVDCPLIRGLNYKVPGEGHPNERMNTIWADCIAGGVKKVSGPSPDFTGTGSPRTSNHSPRSWP